MPIAGLTDLIAHANSPKFIEPVKRNNARLTITTGNLFKLLKSQFGQDEPYLQSLSAALSGGTLPLDVSFTPPSISTESRKVYGLNNITVKYGGYTDFGTCACSFNNFIGANTYRFFYRWAMLPGAIRIQQNDTSLEPVEPSGSMALPDLSSVQAGYKVNGFISQYYTYDPLGGEEIAYDRWILQGMWPSSVTTTGFDLGGDQGSMVQTSVEFTVDMALPVAGDPLIYQQTSVAAASRM